MHPKNTPSLARQLPSLRLGLSPLTQNPRHKHVRKDKAYSNVELIPAQPTLTRLPRDLGTAHHRTRVAGRQPHPQRIRRRRTRLLLQARLVHDMARPRIDPPLAHVLPILLVRLGPLGAELGAAVAGLDRAQPFRVGRLHAGDGARGRAAARAVPPPRPRREDFALRRRRPHRARRHLLGCHERQQPH